MRSSFTLFIILLTFSIYAQTLEHHYAGAAGECHQVGYSDYVYHVYNGNNSISLYTLDHSLIKTTDLNPGGSNYQSIIITKTLFNSDQKYEISYVCINGGWLFEVVDEDGSLLMRDSLVTWYKFRNTNQGVKLLTSNYTGSFLKVYSLPGQLYSDIEEKTAAETDGEVFPNPTNNHLTIVLSNEGTIYPGQLEIFSISGELLLKTPIASGIKEFILNTSGYSKGIYLYRFGSAGQEPVSGKFIIQ